MTELKQIKNFKFNLLSKQDILELSVVPIFNIQSFDGGRIVPHGLFDLRMGSLDARCQTCDGLSETCPGHFGHIMLEAPVFHQGLMDLLTDVLKCVCFHCSRLMVDKNDPKYQKLLKIVDPEKRVKAIIKLAERKKRCIFTPYMGSEDWCGEHRAVIHHVETLRINIEFPVPYPAYSQETEFQLTAKMARKILKKIHPDDYEILGFKQRFCEPASMTIRALIVVPPPVRPSNKSNPVVRGEDDSTKKYAEILRVNNNLKTVMQNKKAGKTTMTIKGVERSIDTFIRDYTSMLECRVAESFDSSSVASQNSNGQKVGKVTKGWVQKIKGKGGRVRLNLMGKRVDFSARTVITPDPKMSLDMIGVPWSIARTLTFPETVNHLNIRKMEEAVKAGPHGTNGANYIILQNGFKLDLKEPNALDTFQRKFGGLQYGMKVETHMRDGDLVLFNRQPSLHRMSIMAHRVKVMPYSTARLHPSATGPYNADFDGDEMNIQRPQTEETKAEASTLMSVADHMITPQSNKPSMGIVQDALHGSRVMTRKDVFLTRAEAMQILCETKSWGCQELPLPAILKPVPLWSGKQVFSCILPKLNYNCKTNHHTPPDDQYEVFGIARPSINPGDTRVTIRAGQILTGNMCKKSLGTSANSLIQIIFSDLGSIVIRDFVDDIQIITGEFFQYWATTVGYGDMDEPPDIKEKMQRIVEIADQKIEEWKRSGISKSELESKINKMLNDARNEGAADTMKYLNYKNGFYSIVTAGSKGSSTHPAQITRCVGQQNIGGNRIPFGYRNRSLSQFKQFDISSRALGFIVNSYFRGLKPHEVWFHGMSSREGLNDTAVKTCETGYLQRRLCKGMEDAATYYDGTVRNSSGAIIQFAYGEDGIDGTWQEWQNLDVVGMDDDKFERYYLWEDIDYSNKQPKSDEEHLLLMEANRLKKDRVLVKDREEQSVVLPANVGRFLDNLPYESEDEFVSRKQVILDVIQLQNKLWKLLPEAVEKWDAPFAILLRTNLSSKKVTAFRKMGMNNWKWILERIFKAFARAIANPGDNVGTLASQSIGEPATQMTLDTFHFAGISDKNVQLGVPRIKEIVNASKKIKTPVMTLSLLKEIKSDKQMVQEIASSLETVYMKDIIIDYEIIYDPDVGKTVIREDSDFVELFAAIPDGDLDEDVEYSQYIVRFRFDGKTLVDRGIRLINIANRIRSFYKDTVYLEYNDEYEKEVVVRMRIIIEKTGKGREELPGEGVALCEEAANVLLPVRVAGIEGIKKTFVREIKGKNEYVIDTQGSNIIGALSCDYIDKKKIYSNNQNEVGAVFGCEAERSCILKESIGVLSFDNNYINRRHPGLMADVMMHTGVVSAYNRHGINRRKDLGPLLKASFEETSEVFHKAARYSEIDKLNGITESIITGTVAPTGTGLFDLTLNADMLKYAVCEPEEIDTKRITSDMLESSLKTINTSHARVFEKNTFEFVPMNYGNPSDDFVPESPSRMDIEVQ